MEENTIDFYLEKLAELPVGNISYKTIHGKKYPYLQWTENGKQKTRIVKKTELESLTEQINLRKEYEKRIKEYKSANHKIEDVEFNTSVSRDKELSEFVAPTTQWKKRTCFTKLHDFVYGNTTDRVFILYGLRRTGKTTMIRQLISEMSKEMFDKTAFIQISTRNTIDQVNSDIRQLSQLGYKYLFINEVTLLDDFIECASLFSDVFATRGLKIVLSGTDSLGFLFSEDRELYDRCFMLHTTFIPYKEFENVLGIKGIDEYIQYGGTMSISGVDYNHKSSTFATAESTNEYVDKAIADNIQHSLKNYQNGTHFRNLADLYEAGELTNAINRIVEDMNHRFTLNVLTKNFKSSDLSNSAKNLLKDRDNPNDVLFRINKQEVTERLRELLNIKNSPKLSIQLTDAHRFEIKEYLDLLDVTVDYDVVSMSDMSKKEKRTAISQPGLRYAQAKALIDAIMDDGVFQELSLSEKNTVKQRIMSDIQGRMLEDIVLIETKIAKPECKVFKLVFAIGEFDMVVLNTVQESCEIYEIKHSKEAVPQQARYLLDGEKCKATEHRYGKIMRKCVLYRGESQIEGDIEYKNVEEYLKELS